ncbi:MAG: DUF1415 domain-containing protein [Myxococcota bacterium]
MDVIARARRWVERVVIGLDLCPFAAAPQRAGRVRYTVSDAGGDAYAILAAVWAEVERLQANPAIETTLLILPTGWDDFDDYLDLIAAAEDLLVRMESEGDIQLASFHPDYRFAEVAADDPSNATNRSPHPMIHLLRASSVAAAVDHHPDVAGIPARNIAMLRSLGAAGLQVRLEE